MQDLNDLYFFVQIVEHGGITAASRALVTPKSKLSRRLAGLEERLGVRLIQRSTRHFAVTDIGQTYYEHCKAMLIEAEAAQEAIEMTRAEPQGLLRVSCPVALLHALVGEMLAEFLAMYPRVNLHLEATNRRVDPLEETIDIAIRVRPPPLEDSSLVMRVLSDRGQCLAASPALLAQMGQPTTPHDLEAWPSLALGGALQHYTWELFTEDGRTERVEHSPRYTTSDMTALRRAAVAGVGVCQFPVMMVLDELSDGALVKVLPEWSPRREIIHAVFPTRRGLLPSVRALIDYLADRFVALEQD